MAKTARFNIEGAVLDLPLRYDEASKMEFEIYPDLLENPVYTPSGERVMLRTPANLANRWMTNPGV